MKKILAFILCLILALGCSGMTALADEEPTELVIGFFSLNGADGGVDERIGEYRKIRSSLRA